MEIKLNDIDSLKNAFDSLMEEQRKLLAQFQEKGQAIFKEAMKGFFDQNPDINALVWTQYTPYFNDGDACEFHVGDVTFTNASDPEDLEEITYGEYNGDDESIWAAEDIVSLFNHPEYSWNKDTFDKIKESGAQINLEACALILKIISSSEMEPIMESMFGDHVRVIATRAGFDVQDFDHD